MTGLPSPFCLTETHQRPYENYKEGRARDPRRESGGNGNLKRSARREEKKTMMLVSQWRTAYLNRCLIALYLESLPACLKKTRLLYFTYKPLRNIHVHASFLWLSYSYLLGTSLDQKCTNTCLQFWIFTKS